MVGAYCASSLPTPLTTTTTSTTELLKPPLLSSSNSTPLPPRKLSRRKNHLRPKILKTLPKPLILPQPPSTNPIIPIVIPPENDAVFDLPTVKFVPAVEEFEETPVEKFEETQVSVSTTEGVAAATEYGAVSGNISAKTLIRIGLGLVGVFVLNTIWSVWIMGRASSDDDKEENLNVLDNKNTNVVNNVSFSVNKNVGFLDETESDYRINEIRAMAREARKMEAKGSKNVEEEDDIVDENVNSKGRIGIEKEINARLVKVEKKLGSRNGKLPGSYLNNLDKFEDNEEAKERDEKLFFKSKFKFRRPSSMSSRSDVKGFGSDNRNVNEKKKSGLIGTSDDSTKNNSGTVDVENNGSDALTTNLNGSRNDMESSEKMQREMEVGNTATRFGNGILDYDENGTVQRTGQGRSLVEVTNSRQPTASGMQNFQKSTEESQETTFKSDNVVMGRNSGSKQSVLGNKSDIQSDLWWLKLPYVLHKEDRDNMTFMTVSGAILMRRGPEHEEEGFFTLRSTSQAQDHSQTPYTVAFENRGDANNFCHLLESYFEDLGLVDFNADIIPLPVKELNDAVESIRRVIVVRKGQLKLYAGQPFADVEMALHSLIE
ncbi:hypothetical protein EZV62_000312 [Acer yangbiense]|uniref:Uncharacterized protein n=1 Tax=Acer yangbiense TaxID=1000413 RepID=A0A5C7IQS4_9ROSI|nr:hypothetical protein EZV62_000312 [Acer yangbiense]